MVHSNSQQKPGIGRTLLASMVPPVLLAVYLLVFRWSARGLATEADYIAVTTCGLVGTIILSLQPTRFWLRAVSIVLHVGLSIALFGFWNWLGGPVLNDIF